MELTYKLYGGLSSAETAWQGGVLILVMVMVTYLMVENARETEHEEAGDDEEAVTGAQPQKQDRY